MLPRTPRWMEAAQGTNAYCKERIGPWTSRVSCTIRQLSSSSHVHERHIVILQMLGP